MYEQYIKLLTNLSGGNIYLNVKKGREYRLTFSKVNPKNNDWIRGKGTLYGAKT